MLSAIDYCLPPERIAQAACEPRDAARLLVMGEGFADGVIADLPALLQPGDLLVANDSRVRRARIAARLPTGGHVELLVLERDGADVWRALARPARRLREGEVLDADGLDVEVVARLPDGEVRLRAVRDLEAHLAAHGVVPLPPYIKAPVAEERYQTTYARAVGSAAAPTAGLHITDRLREAFAERGIRWATVDLHVGLATFRPVTAATLDAHPMHQEWFRVPEATAAALRATRADRGRVVAVGTTSLRALEASGGTATEGETDLFIRPGYRFGVVDGLLTNFHAPRTTLLALLAAFCGPRWRSAYEHALANGYRFLSLGDAMFCWRKQWS